MSEEIGSPRVDSLQVVRVVAIGGGTVLGAVLAWKLRYVLFLAFAAALFAIALRGISRIIVSHSPIGPRFGLTLATLLTAATIVGFFYLMGAQIHAQLKELLETLPSALSNLGVRLGIEGFEEQVVQGLESLITRTDSVSQFVAYMSAALAAVGAALLVLFSGVFFAARPDFYRRGMLQFLPKRARPKTETVLASVRRALERWLLGQLISMLLIGAITTAGLYFIGVPSAVALGFLAGIAEFVPTIGPILSFIPALLVAAQEGLHMVLAVLALYLVVQQVESNLIMPLVQRRVVDLPPALALFSVLAFALLFGPLGLLLATPMTVALLVVVKQLYVRDQLNETTRLPGEPDD